MLTPSVYGNGAKFPFQLDATNARPAISSDEDLVKQSIDQILNTIVGERPFLFRNGQAYGTRIRLLLFDSSLAAIEVVKFEVKRAIETWEPRVILSEVQASARLDNDGAASVVANVRFRYRATNRVDNFVVPYRISPLAT
jgi:phage baseplate assembly protein W